MPRFSRRVKKRLLFFARVARQVISRAERALATHAVVSKNSNSVASAEDRRSHRSRDARCTRFKMKPLAAGISTGYACTVVG